MENEGRLDSELDELGQYFENFRLMPRLLRGISLNVNRLCCRNLGIDALE